LLEGEHKTEGVPEDVPPVTYYAGSTPLDIPCYNKYYHAVARSIRDEIKQTKPFERLSSEAAVSLMRTAAVMAHQADEILRPHGITGTQYNVLRILRGSIEGLCGRDVGERMVARVPDVSRLLDRLEQMKLIRRERDPNDRRHVTARITSAGLKVLEAATPELEAFEERWFGRIERRRLKDVIEVLAEVRQG